MDFIHFAVVFLLMALVAGFFGFYNVKHAAIEVARILFFIFIILFILALFSGCCSYYWSSGDHNVRWM